VAWEGESEELALDEPEWVGRVGVVEKEESEGLEERVQMYSLPPVNKTLDWYLQAGYIASPYRPWHHCSTGTVNCVPMMIGWGEAPTFAGSKCCHSPK
jgi:hypothetical protein